MGYVARIPRALGALTLAGALAVTLAGCGGGRSPKAARSTTTAPVLSTPPKTSASATTTAPTATTPPSTTTTSPTTTTTRPPTTTTRPPTTTATTTTTAKGPGSSSFPTIVNQAMEALQPPASGMEAPTTLPATNSFVSAEANKSLDGSYSVTLIATTKPEPVNSAALGPAAADPSSDLGTFSTTPVDSASTAASYLQSALTGCAGSERPLQLTSSASTAAATCSTAQGPAVVWNSGGWKVQVLDEGGTSVPYAQATALASWLRTHSLPSATQGVISVTVPGSPQAGTATTSAVIWYLGEEVYQVSAPGSELAALYLAAAMRPWPGG